MDMLSESLRSVARRGTAHARRREHATRYPHGCCPLCQRTRSIPKRHPVKRCHICRGCWTELTGRRTKRPRGYCTHCRRGPRDISYRHPETSTSICQTCSWHLRGVRRCLKRGACPDCPCDKGDRILQYFDEDRQVWVCRTCFFRLTGRKEKRRKKPCQRCGLVSGHVAVRMRFGQLLCDACFDRLRGRRRQRPPSETCPNCGHDSQAVQYGHNCVRWCLTCHRRAIRYTLPQGQCFECGSWRELSRRHWRFDLVICRPCFDKHKKETQTPSLLPDQAKRRERMPVRFSSAARPPCEWQLA